MQLDEWCTGAVLFSARRSRGAVVLSRQWALDGGRHAPVPAAQGYLCHASSSALASCRSAVSKPSVNQP